MKIKKKYIDIEYLLEWRLRKALQLWHVESDRHLFDAADKILREYRDLIVRLRKSDLN